MMTSSTRDAAPVNQGSVILWSGAAALLLLPAVAMRFTAEVQWTALDFATFAVMLGGAGGAYELLARRGGGGQYRLAAALAVLTGLLLVWVNLAVGIIGSERNDANLMYAGVLAVAVGGACLARLRAGGMARAMLATAAAQLLVGAAALAFGLGAEGAAWPKDVIGATAVLSAMWLASAWLFRRAAQGF